MRRTLRDAMSGSQYEPVVWGSLLVLGGVLLLLQTLGVLAGEALVWGPAFALAGLVFAGVFASRRPAWWAAIPAGALFGLAAAILWSHLAPASSTDLGGAAFLGLTALGFWAIYLRDHDRWWALIPGGVGLTLALLAAFAEAGDAGGAMFFAGLAVTFLLVGVLPTGENPQRWAFVPGAILVLVAVLLAAGAGGMLDLLNYVWPVALIAGGLYWLWRGLHSRRPGPG